MKRALFIGPLCIALTLQSCDPQDMIDQAFEARKKRDSIFKEFKKVNDSLTNSLKHFDSVIHQSDSLIISLKHADSLTIRTDSLLKELRHIDTLH